MLKPSHVCAVHSFFPKLENTYSTIVNYSCRPVALKTNIPYGFDCI